jgi:cell division protein FtsN
MRRLFLGLLLLNLALFGWLRGMFGAFPVSGREPARLERQVAAERIRVLTDGEVAQLEKRAGETKVAAATTAAALAPDSTVSCVEIGEFANDAALARLREKLSELKLTDRASEQTRDRPGWYQVYLPSEKALADAEQRAEQLRAQGLKDVLVFKEEGTQRFAIGLGSFRDREQARRQVAQLERRGVKGARVADNPAVARTTRVLIRGADAASIRQLEAAQKDFPQQKLQACGPDAP